MRKYHAPAIVRLLGISLDDAIRLDEYLYAEKHINWLLHPGWYIHYAEEISIDVPTKALDYVNDENP